MNRRFIEGIPNKINKVSKYLLILGLLILLMPLTASAKLPGKYELIVPYTEPPQHSLDKVTLNEVFAFDCSHCYHFYKSGTLKALEKKFGKRLVVHMLPIGWRGPDPGRLYFIALEKGKGEQVLRMIFDFIFEKGLGSQMFTRDKLQFVARANGLVDEFNTMMDSPEIVSAMNKSVEYADNRQINSTPTIVIEDVLTAERNYNNLESIINSLLKDPVR